MEKAIELTPDLFVCGIAINLRDMLDLFGQVFLLSIDAATQIERLATAGEREPSLWQPIIDGRPVFEDEMQTVGATASMHPDRPRDVHRADLTAYAVAVDHRRAGQATTLRLRVPVWSTR